MIGKIAGSMIGAEAARHARGISGPAGALLGAGAVAVVRRMGPMGLIVTAAGGYAYKRYAAKRRAQQPKVEQPHIDKAP